MVLTISPGATLEIDLRNFKLLVRHENGVLIQQRGTIRQSTESLSPSALVPESLLIFHHEDHLSGGSVDTDDTGNILQLLDYYPFGETRVDESSDEYENDYKFTGKELDEDTGLYYYEARYYDPSLARFISVDPWQGDIFDPQSFNKYSYVRNNPLKYVDVTGEFWEEFLNGPKNIYTLGKELYRGIQKGTENFKLSEKGTQAVKESNQFSKDVQPVLEGALIAAGTLSGMSTGGTVIGSISTSVAGVAGIENIEKAIDPQTTQDEAKSTFFKSTLGFILDKVSIPLQKNVPQIANEMLDAVNTARQEVLGFAGDTMIDNSLNQSNQEHSKTVSPSSNLQFGASLENIIKESNRSDSGKKEDE